jgi:thiosulfate/3-mercaptopyruvate sulfurtransferase
MEFLIRRKTILLFVALILILTTVLSACGTNSELSNEKIAELEQQQAEADQQLADADKKAEEEAGKAEQADADKKAAAEKAAKAAEDAEAAKLAEEKAAAERAEAEKALADAKAAEEKAAAEKAEAEKALADAKTKDEKAAAEKALEESKVAAERAAAEKAAAEKVAAEKAAAEKAAAEKAAAEKIAAEKAAADKAAAEKILADSKAAAEKAAAEKAAAEKIAAEKAATYPNAQLLVEPDWLEANLKSVVILDARSNGFDKGRIPGAVNLKSNSLNDPNNPVEGFLHGEEKIGEIFRKAGINQDSTIVVYDDGNSLSAARIFYALELYGLKDQVKILNGGYKGWTVANKPVSTEATTVKSGNFVAKLNTNLISTKEQIKSITSDQKISLLDTRSSNEFNGRDVRAKYGGTIPGAKSREWSKSIENNKNGVPVFKTFAQLKEEFESVGAVKDQTIVPFCQTNVRGAHTYFTLRLLGYSDIRPYEGSWAEWGNAEDVSRTYQQ